MTGKRLLRRIAVVMGALSGFLLFLAAMQSEATPIRPNVKKLLSQPEQTEIHLGPARAGWNGPEIAQSSDPSALALFGTATDAQEVRESLISAFIPDPRAVAFLLAVILLLRQFRNWRVSRSPKVVPTGTVVRFPSEQSPQELRPAA